MPAGELLQQAGRIVYRGLPLHFGRGGVHRHDAPDGAYGVCYLAFDLATALMESVFHRHSRHRQRRRSVALAEAQARMVRAVGTAQDVALADLTAPRAGSRCWPTSISSTMPAGPGSSPPGASGS